MAAEQFVSAQGHAIVAALDHILDEEASQVSEKLAEAVELLVGLRDGLIDRQRAGEPCGQWLGQTNALISSMLGTEFPIKGLQWNRVCETRDALKRMLAAA